MKVALRYVAENDTIIRLLNRDIMIFYLYEGRWNSILVPAGADLPVGLPFGSI